jgi:hypothetical protein
MQPREHLFEQQILDLRVAIPAAEPRTKVTAIHALTLGAIVNISATTRTRQRNPHNLGLGQLLPESPLTVEQVFHNYDPVGWP